MNLRGFLRTYHLRESDRRWQLGIDNLQAALGSLREAGELELAISYYDQLHDLRKQTLPEDHLLLAYTAHGPGNAQRERGR